MPLRALAAISPWRIVRADNWRLARLNVMRDWRVCLEEYLRDYYGGYL